MAITCFLLTCFNIIVKYVHMLFFHLSLPTVFFSCWTLDIQGHEKEALQLMATYLPKDTSPGSAYQEGGGLYALGLIHANHGGDIIDYLLNQLKNASNDVCTGFSDEPLFCWEYPERVLACLGLEVTKTMAVVWYLHFLWALNIKFGFNNLLLKV